MSKYEEMGQVKEVKLQQGTVRYREIGTGEPLVFIHGVLVNGDLWQKIVPGLAKHYRCIVPDLPLGGHELGMNPKADLTPLGIARIITGFLEALELTNVTMVANDSGGAFTQVFITEYPTRVARLILTNCDCYENFPPQSFAFLDFWVRVPGFIYLIGQSVKSDFLRKLLLRTVSNVEPEQKILDSFYHSLSTNGSIRRDLHKVLKGASNCYTEHAATKFSEFKKPVLIVWGEDDIFFTKNYALRLAQDFPQATLEFIPNAMTFVSQDQPEKLQATIETFLTHSH